MILPNATPSPPSYSRRPTFVFIRALLVATIACSLPAQTKSNSGGGGGGQLRGDLFNKLRLPANWSLVGHWDVVIRGGASDGDVVAPVSSSCPPTPPDMLGPYHLPPEQIPEGLFPVREEACIAKPTCEGPKCRAILAAAAAAASDEEEEGEGEDGGGDNGDGDGDGDGDGPAGEVGGIPLVITGRVRSQGRGCAPLADARVDVWQADSDGRYWNERDIWRRDTNSAAGGGQPGSEPPSHLYNCRADARTDKEGRFRFVTTLPGLYGGGSFFRPSHIHVRVVANGHPTLVTQLYFRGDTHLSQPHDGPSVVLLRLIKKHVTTIVDKSDDNSSTNSGSTDDDHGIAFPLTMLPLADAARDSCASDTLCDAANGGCEGDIPTRGQPCTRCQPGAALDIDGKRCVAVCPAGTYRVLVPSSGGGLGAACVRQIECVGQTFKPALESAQSARCHCNTLGGVDGDKKGCFRCTYENGQVRPGRALKTCLMCRNSLYLVPGGGAAACVPAALCPADTVPFGLGRYGRVCQRVGVEGGQQDDNAVNTITCTAGRITSLGPRRGEKCTCPGGRGCFSCVYGRSGARCSRCRGGLYLTSDGGKGDTKCVKRADCGVNTAAVGISRYGRFCVKSALICNSYTSPACKCPHSCGADASGVFCKWSLGNAPGQASCVP